MTFEIVVLFAVGWIFLHVREFFHGDIKWVFIFYGLFYMIGNVCVWWMLWNGRKMDFVCLEYTSFPLQDQEYKVQQDKLHLQRVYEKQVIFPGKFMIFCTPPIFFCTGLKGLNFETPKTVNLGIQALHEVWKNNWTNSRDILSSSV